MWTRRPYAPLPVFTAVIMLFVFVVAFVKQFVEQVF